MSNPNFIPTFSSNEIYRDTDDTRCLTDDLDTIESDIDALESSKADTAHTHTEYAAAVHTHAQYADIDHTHAGYAATAHSHSEYALATDVDALEDKVGDTAVSSQIAIAIAAKADANHTHTEYALANHEHTGYAASSHGHSEYAAATHTHDGYASSSHTHSYNDLEDKPTIPTTLPANGGDADTVDGKHANEFATAPDMIALQALVGETSVSSQINEAIENIDVDITVDDALSATSTNPIQNKIVYEACNLLSTGLANHTHDERYYQQSAVDTLLNAKANVDHVHNVFSSLTEIGITTFPTTMQLVSEAMPTNSMIVIDTRRINGTESDYNTETISDWGNTANGVAIIIKGVSTARIGMMILYGTTTTTSANIHYGSYAHDANNVNWVNIDERYARKMNNYSAVDLNTLTVPGLYYVSSGTTDLHFPVGSNGHMLVMSDGSRIRQVFFRMGTIDSNSFQWYSRNRSSATTDGVDGDGWSQWWLLSGCEIAWSGTAKLDAEINLGSRYGCQGWVIAGQPTKTDTFSTIYIPRYFLTTDTDKWKLQIADETGYVSFYFYYKESDNNVYAKVVWVSDTTNSALRYVYRVS